MVDGRQSGSLSGGAVSVAGRLRRPLRRRAVQVGDRLRSGPTFAEVSVPQTLLPSGGAGLPSTAGFRVTGTYGEWSTDGRLRVEAVAINGRAAGVEFRLLGDLVSVGRVTSGVVSLLDRNELRRWVVDALSGFPMAELSADDVRLSVGEGGRVAVSLTETGLAQTAIEAWELSPVEVCALVERI